MGNGTSVYDVSGVIDNIYLFDLGNSVDVISSCCTISFVDAKVSLFNISNESRCETCIISSYHGYTYGGYTGLNSGTAEVIAVSYCAPDLLYDCTAPDALY